MMARGLWTKEAEEALRLLIQAGFSAAQAAKELRRQGAMTGTRNSMIGKAKRMGISFHSVRARKVITLPAIKFKGAAKPVKVPPPATEPAPPPPAALPKPPPAPKEQESPRPDKPAPRVHPDAVSFMDLPYRGQCKFPLWPTQSRLPLDQKFYCGAATDEDDVYCTECKQITRAARAA